MTNRVRRRDFLRTTAAAGIGFWVAGGVRIPESRAANETVNFACVGVGGRGFLDSADCERKGNIVAICDVDETNLARKASLPGFSKAKQYFDFRKMLEVSDGEIDAVTISTPDHTHAVATAMAIRMGKHCFTQKPLARTVGEVRQLTELAAASPVATQMGNQGTAKDSHRLGVAAVRAGVLGTVKEVHVFTDRPVWRHGVTRPVLADPVPPQLHWNEWIGPAATRPYANEEYHQFNWRGWWDFGTGALGDMACHTANMPFAALDLRNPATIVARTSGHSDETFPGWSVVEFEFAATDQRPPVKMIWYDGKQLPPKSLLEDETLASCSELAGAFEWSPASGTTMTTGALLLGDKGALFAKGDCCDELFFIGVDHPKDLPIDKSPGHFDEWVNAIKFGQTAMSNFPNYAGPLTETVLLGNLAVWANGTKIQWDAQSMLATNAPDLTGLIHPVYRDGYTL